MAEEDRYSIAEFARRYKVSEKELPAFCELFGVSQDTVLTREEFKGMLARFESSVGVEEPPQPTQEPQEEAKEEAVPKKKRPLAQWVTRKITRARVFKTAYLKSAMNWKDDTKLTEDEFDNAVRKHILNKE